MKVTILGSGTSQGIPVIACQCEVCRSEDRKDKRLRSSALVETEGKRLLIDAGPDFRYQMLRSGITDLRAILLTHAHKDHTGGLDDIRAFNWIKGGAMDLYCDGITEKAVRKDYDYCFSADRYPGIPELCLHTIGSEPFYIDGIRVDPIPVCHHCLPITAYRIGPFAYLTDVSDIPEDSIKRLKGVEVLVISALRHTPHPAHFTLRQALRVIDALEVKQAYITHIGHQMGLHGKTTAILPAGVSLAYDTLSFEF